MVLQVITGDGEVLRRVFPLLALSSNAKDAVSTLSRNLSFLVFGLCGKGQGALVVARFQLDLVERLEMLKSSSDYCNALFGLGWAQSLLPEMKQAAVRTLEDLQHVLEGSLQSRVPIYGRCILLLGSTLLELDRPAEALPLLKQAVDFYQNDAEGRARALIPYRAALSATGGAKDEMANELAANSAVFATLSRLGYPKDGLLCLFFDGLFENKTKRNSAASACSTRSFARSPCVVGSCR